MRLAAVTVADAKDFPTIEAQVALRSSTVGNELVGVVGVGGVVAAGVLAGSSLPPPHATNVTAQSAARVHTVADAKGRFEEIIFLSPDCC
jgi:hypothetical protein